MKPILIAFLCILAGISLKCGNDFGILENANVSDNVYMFSVVSTSPSDGVTSVPVNSVVTVALNDNCDESTLPGNFIVQKSGIPVAGALGYDPITKTITFTPGVALSTASLYTVLLTRDIKNEVDEELNPEYFFSFTTAAGSEPEFDLYQGAIAISIGDIYDFGTVTVGDPPRDIVFTIKNPGTGPLNLTGGPYVQVGGLAFSINSQPVSPIGAGGNTAFTVRFAPPTAGDKSEVITIPNNDVTENPYIFTVIGVSQPSGTFLPEINVKQGNKNFPSDSKFDFGKVKKNQSSVPVPFTIENLGNANLSVSSIVLGGEDAGMFSVSPPALPTAVLPGASISFTVTFSPTDKGNFHKVYVQILNDDSNENPYIINLKGHGK